MRLLSLYCVFQKHLTQFKLFYYNGYFGFMRHLHQYSLTSPAVPISNQHNPSFRFQKPFQKEKVPVLCSTGPPSDLYTAALQTSFYSIIKQATLASLICPRMHSQSPQRGIFGSGGHTA